MMLHLASRKSATIHTVHKKSANKTFLLDMAASRCWLLLPQSNFILIIALSYPVHSSPAHVVSNISLELFELSGTCLKTGTEKW